jgi:hypothetical protein
MRFVTQQEYEELRKDLKQRALHLSSNVVIGGRFGEFQKVAIYHFLDGAQEFSRWSSKMQEDFGEPIRPHLQEIWLGMPWAARKIADRLLAHILKQGEIVEIETTVGLFARIKSDSVGKYSLSSVQRIRLAAQIPLDEISRMFEQGRRNPTPQQERRPNAPGRVARDIAATERQSSSLSYQCPSCGRVLRRGDVLLQEWGDKAAEYMNAEFMAQAGDYVWDYALDNFKALHECVPVPTENEIRRKWKGLALRKLFRHIVVGWVILMGLSLLSGERLSFPLAILLLFACALFFAVGVPALIALSVPLSDVEFRTAWAHKNRTLWEDWKASLIADQNKRDRELARVGRSFLKKQREQQKNAAH